jgi:hypothetical protein
VVATVVKTRADRNDEVRVNKAKATIQLLLAREGINADGEAVLIPGELDPSFEDLLQETPRNAFRNLSMLFKTHIEGTKETDPMHLLYFATHFPYVMITPIFAAAFMGGHWATEPIHADAASLGQNLGVLSFVPTKTNTAEHKRQLDESNSILGEDLVSADSTHRTKASLTLFDGGNVQFHSQAMTTIANLHAALAVCDNTETPTPSISSTCLKEAFTILAQPDMKQWVERFSRKEQGGEHLPYALILDLHNSWIHLSRMVTDPRWIRAVLKNEDIPASAIAFFKATHTQVINKWQKAVGGDTLGPYASPPSTWVSSKVKDQAKKSSKGTDVSSPAGGRNPPSRFSGPDRRQHQVGRSSGSDPNMGMIIAPDNVRNGPQLSSGKRLCLAFARKGKSCTYGFNCTGDHLSLRNATLPDLKTIEQWIENTANVSWVGNRPSRLDGVPPPPGAAPPIPPTHQPAANQVTPEAANSNPASRAQG